MRIVRWFPFIIIAAAFLAHFVILGNDFVFWDDPLLITQNPLVRHFSLRIFTTYDPELFIPITLLSFQIEHALFGFNPFFFHLTNLALHIVNALLVFWVCSKLLKDRWFPFFVALIFAVHPLHVEAVAWASARKELLSTFFFLASVMMYVLYIRKGEVRIANDKTIISSFFFFLLALGSKVSTITLPFVLLLIDWQQGRKFTLESIKEKWPYFLFALPFGVLAFFGKIQSAAALTIPHVLLLACKSTFFYMQKLLIPMGLSAIYPSPPPILFSSPTYFVPLVLILVLMGLLWIFRNSARDAVFGVLLFLITLSTSFFAYQKTNLVQIASDRYAYLPSIGFFIAIGALILFVCRKNLQRQIAAGCVIAIACIFAVFSYAQSRVWQDSLTLFRDVLTKDPTSHIAYNNIGFVYMQGGQLDDALRLFREATRLRPDYAEAHLNIGVVEGRKGNYAEAERSIREAIKYNPNFAFAYFNLGGVHFMRQEYTQAIDAYAKSIALDSSSAQAYAQLAQVLLKEGRSDEAREAYRKAIAIDPSFRGRSAELDAFQL